MLRMRALTMKQERERSENERLKASIGKRPLAPPAKSSKWSTGATGSTPQDQRTFPMKKRSSGSHGEETGPSGSGSGSRRVSPPLTSDAVRRQKAARRWRGNGRGGRGYFGGMLRQRRQEDRARDRSGQRREDDRTPSRRRGMMRDSRPRGRGGDRGRQHRPTRDGAHSRSRHRTPASTPSHGRLRSTQPSSGSRRRY